MKNVNSKNNVANWFGESYQQLHPLIRQLHDANSTLNGKVQLQYGQGIGKLIGNRLGKKVGLPPADGIYHLSVNIRQEQGCLIWERSFDNKYQMISIFKPIGDYPDGCWLEQTGNITIKLGVELNDAGWYWQPRSYHLLFLPIPKFLFPKTIAFKRVKNNQYEFVVRFNMPIIGKLLSYKGMLELSDNE